MKSKGLLFLRWILRLLARLTIWKFRPGVVGVTGSVGKTSAKRAIAAVLRGERTVRFTTGNLNNDFGLPLAILGEWREKDLILVSRATPSGANIPRKIFFWLRVVVSSVWRLLTAPRATYPEILVLEYGADKPGDLRYLLDIARPNVGVITAIGEVPVHVEFFEGPAEVAREKARLIEYLPSASFAVLNRDDATVMNLKNRTRAHLLTFGFEKDAEVRIANFENRTSDSRPLGITFKLEYGGSTVPVRLDNVFGRTQAYAAAAAAAVGIIFGLNLIKISENLKQYIPAAGRMRLLSGVKSTWVLDDAYNASPLSMHAALDTLRDLPGARKVAVLGDMLEIGRYAMQAHERVGRQAAGVANVLITVGAGGKLIADSARAAGLNRRFVQSFDTAEAASRGVQKILRAGDLVLVKASHAVGLDKVVAEIIDDMSKLKR